MWGLRSSPISKLHSPTCFLSLCYVRWYHERISSGKSEGINSGTSTDSTAGVSNHTWKEPSTFPGLQVNTKGGDKTKVFKCGTLLALTIKGRKTHLSLQLLAKKRHCTFLSKRFRITPPQLHAIRNNS